MAKVYFVTGKGGTGKSSLARSLAAKFAGEGQSALLLKINSFALGQEGDSGPRQVNQSYWEQKIHQRRAVEEYFVTTLSKLPLPGAFQKFAHKLQEGISARLLGNKFVMRFIDACPGLTPTIFLGKICWEAQEGGPASGKLWDTVIVDAPSTGQALQIFESSRILSRILSQGMIAKHIQDTLRFSNNENFQIHIVTLPEEGPLQECEELVENFQKLGLQVSRIWINKVTPNEEVDLLKSVMTQSAPQKDIVQTELRRIDDQGKIVKEFEAKVTKIPIFHLFEHLEGEPLSLEGCKL